MMPRSAGSALRARAGGPSVTRLIQSICSGNDGREVVVGEDHVGRFLRDVGARYAHRHAYVGLSQGRSIVYAVAGHSNDVALILQSLDYVELVLRRDSRVDGHPL